MKNQSSKRHKGKVNVHDCNGVLRIGLPRHLFPGQRKYIYLGLQDTPDNRELAEAKAKEIESDIVYERFDYTLKKYKQQPPPNQDEVKITTLQYLYYEYINTRKKTVRPGTWNNNYMVALRHIQRSPFCNGDISMIIGQDVFDWAIQNLTIDTTSRLMTQLNACFKWAIEKRLVSEPSPFKDLSAKADRLKKASDSDEINPFTANERDRIIQVFDSDPLHSHYSLYVRFCFFTGCRPSEAIALRWSDVAADLSQITFSSVIVRGEGGRKRCDGLKSQTRRDFPCNEQVQTILREARSQKHSEIVFPSKTGKPIQDCNFGKRHWHPVLKKTGIKQRKPYQMRHTFITLCLDVGIDAKDVAAWVGNSPQVIYQNYAGRNRGLSIPKL
ncbi:site-specific integrase [Limnospira fusiformis KN01]|uniref:tyrosine-type recombinase/integrase n=1 Tax=Limnospira fusiformis TaxID=54297 RepID=UPI00165891C2|nr:tyrosine-type recombinase/integrase [Limnospira fusiformis]ULB44789.1 site-specific integrase [Limnospira fusiformis KN01]